MNKKHIASVSFGKDSLAMVHGLIERGMPLDEVVFYDTGMEFDAVYAERDRTLPLLKENGIRYVELKPAMPFWESMFVRPVKKRGTQEVHKHGYGWCGGSCRWGTTEKCRQLDRYAEAIGAMVYVGIAADELPRLAKEIKPYKLHPLADWGMTEADCLASCYSYGHEWNQDGVRLYDVLDRVSCWCCRNKNMKELAAIRKSLPAYWWKLRGLESHLGQMKSRPLDEIGEIN